MIDRTTEFQDLQTKYALQAQRTEIELRQLNYKVTEQKLENEKHLEILGKISSQVADTQVCLEKLNNKVDLSTQKLQSEIEKINQLDEQQNKILDEHIAGVNTLKEMHTLQKNEVGARLKDLEKPREWLKMTRKGILWLGGLAAAVMTILKLLEVF